MSYSFVITGNSAVLSAEYHPPIYLDENVEYVIGLVNFETFNTIPNIDIGNNLFLYNSQWVIPNMVNGQMESKIVIPPGSYELEDLNKYIKDYVLQQNSKDTFEMWANNNTLRTHFKTSVKVTFKDGTIGKVLGFKNGSYEANKEHESDYPAEIIKVNSININCSIAEGSYLNGQPVHIIHQFFPNVSPGFKIIESPQNVIYFPVTGKIIDKIIIKIVDQDGELVNFRGETITLRLHLRELNKRW